MIKFAECAMSDTTKTVDAIAFTPNVLPEKLSLTSRAKLAPFPGLIDPRHSAPSVP